jgi:hypothetical protein
VALIVSHLKTNLVLHVHLPTMPRFLSFVLLVTVVSFNYAALARLRVAVMTPQRRSVVLVQRGFVQMTTRARVVSASTRTSVALLAALVLSLKHLRDYVHRALYLSFLHSAACCICFGVSSIRFSSQCYNPHLIWQYYYTNST